jgi:rhodanese-related sulfurtransferase
MFFNLEQAVARDLHAAVVKDIRNDSPYRNGHISGPHVGLEGPGQPRPMNGSFAP